MVTALKFEPNKSPYPCQICDHGEYLNHCISPDFPLIYTASSMKLEDNIAVIYCQNGHLFSLPPNRKVGKLIICGAFYIVGVKDGLLQSLTDTDVVKYSLQYWRSESYSDEEIIDSWLQYPA